MSKESHSTNVVRRFIGRFGFVLFQAAVFVALSTWLRGILLERFGPIQVPSFNEKVGIFREGFHQDWIVATVLFAPLAAWLAFVSNRWLESRWHRRLLLTACGLFWFLALFVFISEFYFFKEYLSRFNTVAIDYIHYWTEVSTNIREMYPIGTILTVCILGAAAIVFIADAFARPHPGASIPQRGLGAVGWTGITILLARSLSPTGPAISSERVVNELAGAGLVSGYTALVTRDLDYSAYYPTMDRDAAWKLIRDSVATPGTTLQPDPYSIERHVRGDQNAKRLNVCIMLEESLGSEFWGVLNDRKLEKSLTPRLDTLAHEKGLLFSNIYADGNRTIRGIEAVLASFPPLPGDSIVARSRTQGVETLASVFDRDGYDTTFIYPGRGVFDDLGNFAEKNGFQHFIEQKDFENPVFKTTWGVCNEDLYDRAIREMRTAHERGQPFFVTTLSVSNHQPFTYPQGRIDAPPDLHSRKNAVRYVDYSLGRFFDMVEKEPFWKDTIFVVVADHGARVYGSQTVPIRSYEIPFLVIGPAVIAKPEMNDTLGCQLDVAPTILGLIGRPYDTVFYGHDLRQVASEQQRVLLTHNRAIGIYRDQRLVTFDLNRKIDVFAGNPKEDKVEAHRLHPMPKPDAQAQRLVDEATALFQTADELYTHRRYRVKGPTEQPTVASAPTR